MKIDVFFCSGCKTTPLHHEIYIATINQINVDKCIQIEYNCYCKKEERFMNDKKLSIKTKKYKGETSVISARIPSEMVEQLDEISNQTGRNRNEVISLCLEFALENVEISEEE